MKDCLRYPDDDNPSGEITETSSELTRTCDTITAYFRDRYLLAPDFMAYYTDFPVTLRALPEEGFRFVHWEVEEGKGSFSDEKKDETELTFEGDIRVRAVFEKE